MIIINTKDPLKPLQKNAEATHVKTQGSHDDRSPLENAKQFALSDICKVAKRTGKKGKGFNETCVFCLFVLLEVFV